MISRRKSQIWRWLSTLLVLLVVLPVAGSILAQSDDTVQTDDSMLPGEVEIVGVLESFDGMTIMVGGIPFDVTGAEIKDDLVVGQLVKIHASFANGLWTAREAELDDAGDDNGNDNVDDGNVNVNDNVDDNDNVGDNGNVNDNVDDNDNDNSDDDNGNDNSDDSGNDNADDNSNDNSSGDDAPDGEFELTGVLEQVGDGFIVVAGQVIDITGAEIKNQLVVGSMVKVHLSLVNGQLVARETEDAVSSGGDDDNRSYRCGDVPEGWTTYVIQGGDTLSGIAVRSDSDDDDLADVNCIENPGQIIVGAEILVPREPDPQSVLIDDNGNDNSDDDNGNDNSDDDNDNSDDDNGNDNSDDDNGNDNSDDDNGNDNGDDDSGDDHGGDDDDGGNSGRGGGDDSDDD